MYSKDLLLLACLGMLLGGLRLTSTTTTTTFVAAMSIGNQDLERYFRSVNSTHALASMTEERIAMDLYTYAFLNYTYHDTEQHNVSFNEEKARYGEGRIFSVRGKLVHVTNAQDTTDDTACTSDILGTRGDSTPPSGVFWIALVQRGGCTFEEKVQHVFDKGASGVIIYNDKPVMNLEKMQIKGKARNITAVITYQDIGLEMARIVDQGIDMEAAIIEGRSGMRPINNLNRTSVLFVSISFIVLMVISLVWLIFYYIQRFRYLQTKDQQSRHLCSVTKKAIMKIPTKTGKSSDEKDADSDCCAICIETYKASDCIRVLPCKHEFHKNCIDPWLIEHRTCPMCKLDVLKFYGFVFLGSEESILEYEPDRPAGAAAVVIGNDATAQQRQTVLVNRVSGTGGTGGALADLIRSRDFVIDFPRIFVLDAGAANANRDTLFPPRLPERSQSSLSLAHAKEWMSVVTNKLEEQHGLRRVLKGDANYEMREHLLDVSRESMKKRRSRSADARYSSGFFGRRELARQLAANEAPSKAPNAATSSRDSRRNSATLRELTEPAYAQSRQRQREEELAGTRRRRSSVRRNSDISLRALTRRRSTAVEHSAAEAVSTERNSRDSTPPLNITIQVNGEGINLD